MQLNIKTNFPDVQRQLATLQADIAAKATASALKKVVAQAKTAMSKEIRAEFNLSAQTVNDSLRVSVVRANGGRNSLEATLSSISRRGKRGLNLINFLENKVTLAAARKRGKAGTLNQLFVQIRRKGGKKSLGSAFIGNNGRTIFVRTGKARLPIKALTTVDLQGMFNTKRINTRVVAMIEAKLPAIFANEARYFTNKFNAARA